MADRKMNAVIAADTKDAQKAMQDFANATKNAAEEAKQAGQKVDDSNVNVRREMNQTRTEAINLANAYKQLSDEEKNSAKGTEMLDHLNELISKYKDYKNTVDEVDEALGKKKKKLEPPEIDTKSMGEQVAGGIAEAADVAQGGISGLVGKLSSISPYTAAAAGIATGIGAIATKSIDAAKEVQTLDTNLGTLLGSQEKGVQLRKQLQKYGQSTPYDTEGLAKAAQTMLGFGVSQEKVMPVMKQLGDIAMGDKDKLAGLSLAYGQMTAQGKVTAQDFNQMVNAGFSYQQMAQSMGISVGELKDRMAQGTVTMDDMNKALTDATSAGGLFYNSAINSSATLEGQLSNMGEAFNSVFADLGAHLLPIATQAVEGLCTVMDGFSAVMGVVLDGETLSNQQFGAWTETLQTVGQSIGEVIGMIGSMIGTIVDLVEQWAEAIVNTDGFRSILEGLQAAIHVVIDAVNIVVDWISDYISSIISAASRSGIFNDILSILGSIIRMVVDRVRLFVNIVKILGNWLTSDKDATSAWGIALEALYGMVKGITGAIRALVEWLEKVTHWFTKATDEARKYSDAAADAGKNTPKQAPKPPKQNGNKQTGGNKKNTKTNGGGNKKNNKTTTSTGGGGHRNTTTTTGSRGGGYRGTRHNTTRHNTTGTRGGGSGKKTETPSQTLAKLVKEFDKTTGVAERKQDNQAYGYTQLDYYKDVGDAAKKVVDALYEIPNPTKEVKDAIAKYTDILEKAENAQTKLIAIQDQLAESQKKVEEANKEKEKLGDTTSKATGEEKLSLGETSSVEGQMSAVKQAYDALIREIEVYKQKAAEAGVVDEKVLQAAAAKADMLKNKYNKLADEKKKQDQQQQINENASGTVESMQGDSFKTVFNTLKQLQDLMASNQKGADKLGASLALAGSALQELGGDGAVAKVGAVLAAIGQIILGFSQASVQAASMGPWGWLAFVGAGLATVATVISTIQSFSTGGIVGGHTPYSDSVPIMAESGEMILNRKQQGNLFKMINEGEMGSGSLTGAVVKVRGSDLYLALSNYSKIKAKSGKITGIL